MLAASLPHIHHTSFLFLIKTRFFVSLANVFFSLNFKQAIARFPQLVRHHQVTGQQTATATAVPIIQTSMPAPIRAPGEGGGARPMRWGITTRCDDPRTSSRRTRTTNTTTTSRGGVAPRVVVWIEHDRRRKARREPIHYITPLHVIKKEKTQRRLVTQVEAITTRYSLCE